MWLNTVRQNYVIWFLFCAWLKKKQVHRLHKIFKYAKEQNVRVMVDAEQSYFQPAIHRWTYLCQDEHLNRIPLAGWPWRWWGPTTRRGRLCSTPTNATSRRLTRPSPWILNRSATLFGHFGIRYILVKIVSWLLKTSFLQAKRQNFYFGAKLVRGAYMEQVLFPIFLKRKKGNHCAFCIWFIFVSIGEGKGRTSWLQGPYQPWLSCYQCYVP